MARLAGNEEWFDERWSVRAARWEKVFGPVASWTTREREAVELVEQPRWMSAGEAARRLADHRKAHLAAGELRAALSACDLGGGVPFVTGKVDARGEPVVIVGCMREADARRLIVVLRAGLQVPRFPPTSG